MGKKICSSLLLMMLMAVSVFAAEKADFTYKGLQIGDTYEEMTQKIGTPRMDISHVTDNRVVTYYVYGEYNDTRIGIDEMTKKVVDMRIGDKKYTTEKDVKIGATPFKLNKVYGQGKKERIGGKVYYIYEGEDSERLMLDISQGYLAEIRITTLED